MGLSVFCSPSAAQDIDVTSRDMIFPGPYAADLVSVVDGDTLDMRVAIWPGLVALYSIRLRGIDAPETWRPSCEGERRAGEAAARHVERLTRDDPRLRVAQVSYDPFANRVIANVSLRRAGRWIDLGDDLVSRDLARRWTPDEEDIPWDDIYCARSQQP